MTEKPTEFDLVEEVEQLVHTTLTLTKIMESQQNQISGMLQVFDMLLQEPSILAERPDVIRKLVDGVRGKLSETEEAKHPYLRLVETSR